MAKSLRKSVKARGITVSRATPLRARLADKVVLVLDVEREAHFIVGQLIAHFAAGYSAEMQNENPGSTPTNDTIFSPSVFQGFYSYLFNSTVTNFMDIQWDSPPVRTQTLNTAFNHGVLARQTIAAATPVPPLTLAVIFETLEAIKGDCPIGAGGGGSCD
jgi:hypothetical protein